MFYLIDRLYRPLYLSTYPQKKKKIKRKYKTKRLKDKHIYK